MPEAHKIFLHASPKLPEYVQLLPQHIADTIPLKYLSFRQESMLE